MDGRRVTLGEGVTWYLDFSRPHRVENHGNEHRIHLVIYGIVSDWVRSMFASSARGGASRNRCLRHPFNHVFRRESSMASLDEWYVESPGLAPAGFIFHMSRCGSTLACRMLSAIDSNIVLSGAYPD